MTPAPHRPLVCVLLATHNGERWLEGQLESLANQVDVEVGVVASDDASTDATLDVLRRSSARLRIDILPSARDRFGNANRNFLRLIRDAEIGSADYVALCDQDDLWLPHKLIRALDELRRTLADIYSSNVIAFWEDGTERILVKSEPQRRFDYLFESAGPGCTFVFKREVYIELRQWVVAHFDGLQAMPVHDWLIYAYARHRGWRWQIDEQATVRYRQHARNEIGANAGLRAARLRLTRIREGRYRRDALAIAAAVGDTSPVHAWLRRFSLADRCHLAINCIECRRNRKEALFLAICFLALFPT